MIPLRKAAVSTIGRKFLMAFTGLGLVLFVIVHLAENLMLLSPNAGRYNAYAAGLLSLGPVLYAAEIGLLVLAIIHILLASALTIRAKAARPVSYDHARSKMGPSKAGFASRRLIVTGAIVLAFLVVHIKMFKYGPDIADGYAMQVAGHEVRDLYRVVAESFHQPLIVVFYCTVMVFLGFHLKHGIWSAFQSLGATNRRTSDVIFAIGVLIGLVLAVGFFLIPIWQFLDLPTRFFGGGV